MYLEFNHKRSISLNSPSEEEIFALILKRTRTNTECKTELEEYCKNLKESNLEGNLYTILKELCEKTKLQQNCNNLKNKIISKCNNFKNTLEDFTKELEKSPLKERNCNEYLIPCILFQSFCTSEFLYYCNQLISLCYEKKRNNVADELLFRALAGNIENKEICIAKLKESCISLSKESDELMLKCLWPKTTCILLTQKIEDRCEILKEDIKNALEIKNELKDTCHFLLEQCYFHTRNCKNELKCEELRYYCKNEVIYYSFPGYSSLILEQNFTLNKKIGLERLYTEMETIGILIGRPLEKTLHHILLLINKNSNTNKNADCIYNLKNNCNSFKYLREDLKYLCDNTSYHNEICKEFYNRYSQESVSFKLTLYKIGVSTTNNSSTSGFYEWYELPETLTVEDCTELISKCFYMEKYFVANLLTACSNLRQACYKTGLYKHAYEMFHEKFPELLYSLNSTKSKNCQVRLKEECLTIKNNSIKLLSLCINPKEACTMLANSFELKSQYLQRALNEKRDYPQEQDCITLEKRCNILTKYFNKLDNPCRTLKKHCIHLRNTKKLKDILLSKNEDILANINNCSMYLNVKCSQWFKRKTNPFSFVCVAQYKSCTIMIQEVQNHCTVLKQNMETQNIIEQSRNGEKDDTCFLWEKYCDMLMKNCPHKLKQNNGEDGLCVKLKENCKTFRNKFPLLRALMYNIRGSLASKDACTIRLKEYCTDSTKSNKTLEDSCKEYNKNDTRDKICVKFIKWMEILCNTLPTKLNKVAKNLKDRAAEFKETKEQAEKAASDSGLLLVVSQTAGREQNHRLAARGNVTAYIRLVRRDDLDIESSVRHGLTFDLMSLVLELYLEAKDICGHFIEECAFEDDCPKFGDPCKEIREHCEAFVLPKVVSPTETSVLTVTVTDSTTMTDDKPKPTVTMKDGVCVAIDSKTTWVTSKSVSRKTKTHTSVTTSTQKCKPVPCTTEDARTKEPETGGADTEVPSAGTKISGLTVMNIVIWRRAQAAQNDEIDEEHIFALILKGDYNDDTKCKKKLKEYCENLKGIDENFRIYSKLKETCKEDKKQEEKCTELKNKVKTKCTAFETELGKVEKDTSKLTHDDCKKNEQQCLFLEGACPKELTEKCNELRNKCYQKKRDGVAEEVLLRAVRGSIESDDDCKKKLKEVCLELSQESNELTKLCLDQETTCKKFVAGKQEKCTDLEKTVKEALTKKDGLRGKCLSLLEQCYFHRGDCQGDKSECNKTSSQNCKEYIPDCDKLAEECQKQNIAYIPPGPPFDPTRPAASLAEDIGLEELYRGAEEDGVVIGGQRVRDATALLALLIQDSTLSGDDQKKCEEVLKEKCKSTHEHETLENLCKGNAPSKDGEDKCKELKDDVKKICDNLKPTILKNNLFDKKNIHNGIIGWEQLPTFLSSEECAKLESYCFYFEKKCQDGEKACMNVRAACYKRGLDARANSMLQREMRGLLHGSNETWRKEFQKKLVEVCGELKGNKGTFPYDELFVLCVQPLKALRLLTHDHQMRTVFLREQLDKKRDFPGDKDCKELGRKCQELEQDSNEIRWPCYTLEQQCERLGTTELLKALLLSEQKDTLKDEENCNGYLKKKCSLWTRRGDGRFSLVCAFQSATCKLMVDDVQSRCKVFEKNIKASNISHEFDENNPRIGSLERFCPFWHSYCSKFGPNCPDLKKKDAFCIKLEGYCEPFYKRKALENALKVEFRGKLSDENKCIPALQSYCTILENVKNASISNLCKTNTKDNGRKDDNQVRKELCQKLVAEVKQQCAILPTELEQPAEDLEKDLEKFNELKKQAEKAIKDSNLVLSLAKTGGDNAENGGKKDAAVNRDKDTMKHVKIVRRGAKDVPVTELEARALDLAADVLARYVELRERCTRLNSDCGIKEDCKTIEGVCKEIDKTCGGLKPLDIRSQKIVTQNVTTTTTKTVGPGGETVEECKSVKTTDTWVTKTSTHTSTSTSTSTITSTVTLTSTRRCKPTKCTTGDEAGDVHPSRGLRMTGWSVRANGHGLGLHVVGQNLARGVARAVKRRDAGGKGVNVYEDEEHLLALILREDNLGEQQCKGKLKGYCGELKKIDPKLDNMGEKLKGICKDGTEETKCKNLQAKVTKKCTDFKTELEKELVKKFSELTDDICLKNQEQCLFLEAACPNELKENCIKLRTNCYQKKREEVAEEALLRALNGDLKEEGLCKAKIKNVCLELGHESDELLKKCIDSDNICTPLVAKAQDKCNSLKTEIGKVLDKDTELQEKGQILLMECHFYEANCKDNKPDCNKLKEKCKEKEIVYTAPSSDFNPTKPEPTVAEKIGLGQLYEEAAAHGILIGKVLEVEIIDLLVFLSGTTAFDDKQCKKVLTDKCKSIDYLEKSIKELCNDTGKHDNKCQEFKQTFEKEEKALAARIENKQFKKNEITLWNEIDNFLTEDDCRTLQSICFYYENQASFMTLCKNVKAACYKKGLDALANELLQERLRGEFYGEIWKSPEKFHKELLEVCKGLKSKSKELFVLCVQPDEALFVLLNDLHAKTNILQEHLDAKRDLPTRQHCTDLLKKCADLEQDSKHIEWPCRTLRHHCARLGVAEQLEEKLLAERVADLDRFDSCVETLRGRCSGWGRRGRTRYALGCVAPNATCTYLTQNVGAKCAVLGGRIQTEGVIAKAKEQNTKEATCRSWMPFCNKFMSSCGNLTAEENKYCKGLKEECKTVIRQLELEEEVIYELKGHLNTKEKCKEELNKYCTIWKNATNGLETLCINKNTKNEDEEVKKELCKKLVEEVKKRCPGLTKRLTEASKELEEKEKEYEDIKKKAVEAMGKANLILSKTKTSDSKAESQAAAPAAVPAVSNTGKNAVQFKLVRRNAAAKAHITEKELEAFDLVSQAFGLYVELKEECEDSLKKCGLRKECEGCKDACEKIDKICLKLEPLEVTEHKKWVNMVWDGHVYLGNDECILPGRSPCTVHAASPAPRTVHASLRTQCIPASQYAVCALDACGRVLDARVCPKLVRNYPAFTPQKNKICVGGEGEGEGGRLRNNVSMFARDLR
ncbi:hypothetical protein PMAC_002583 [Pneumocystis sp. 'macacae']|nr:hypothetical protein PMAC_002583 [Pneumocystis sp. 'macacae']